MLSIECILEKFDDVIANSVLGREAFSPRQNLSRVESGLFYREGECQSERQVIGRVGVVICWGVCWRRSSLVDEKCVNRVRKIILGKGMGWVSFTLIKEIKGTYQTGLLPLQS